MDVSVELLKDYSKSNTVRVARMIGPEEELFDQLMALFFSEDALLASRAAWVARHIFDDHPRLFDPYINKLIRHLEKPVPNGVKRCIVYMLHLSTIPDSREGKITDLCFGLLNNAKEPVANRIFAMSILYNITRKYPELKMELEESIRMQLPYASAGFKNRGQKILNKLK